MVALTVLARHLQRHLVRQVRLPVPQRSVPVRRCNLSACSSRFVQSKNLTSVHPMWQEPLEVPGGDRQSPIDISVRKSVFDPNLKPLVTQYDPRTCQQIWNNGYSFLVEYDDTTDKSTLRGGPLEDQFRLCQFHFHWGENNTWGSEHTVDRNLYPAELHLVHWNADKYALFEEAVMEENGLAVIGVFLKVGKTHEGLQKLVDALPAVRHKLAVFRSLLFTSAEEEVQKSMVNNFRFQQPLKGRTVRSSFTPFL
ncbi:carbonic anhydrase 5A, mitochondrial isoform X3 [Hemibagrus wyckioides]|uniref:carbonic anhydrase 5A, mitochondrial isoform X3 n=1 Tax=Hemibagrus wyckioides TaxID=337641 RepID=UPI00266C27A4|nr:carbonic anhydrase 5A, mitochondrial isoform X3 [Hemibagrus wyckioides]